MAINPGFQCVIPGGISLMVFGMSDVLAHSPTQYAEMMCLDIV